MQMPEVQPEYIELARSRGYKTDGRCVAAMFNDRLRRTHSDTELRHAKEQVFCSLTSCVKSCIPLRCLSVLDRGAGCSTLTATHYPPPPPPPLPHRCMGS